MSIVTTTAEAAVTRPLPRTVPFARGPVLSIAAVVAVVHMAASFVGEYWFDEVYIDRKSVV